MNGSYLLMWSLVVRSYKQIMNEVIMDRIKNRLLTVALLSTSTFAITALSIGSALASSGGQYYIATKYTTALEYLF